MKKFSFKTLLIVFLLAALKSSGQTFSSGPIPMCDTSVFTCSVSGIGSLEPLGSSWGFTLYSIGIDITTDHPQTLVITLTSPGGTNLLLSAYNGAGGVNYTSTYFMYSGYPNITTGSAPFTNNWTAQGGPLSAFDFEWADGTWTITVIDTACNAGAGGSGPGSASWTDGYFNGSASGGIAFAPNTPPCPMVPSNAQADICAGGTFDMASYFNGWFPPWYSVTYSYNGNPVANPSAVSTQGYYDIQASDGGMCWYWVSMNLVVHNPIIIGSDQTIPYCNGPVNLTSYVNTSLIPFNALYQWYDSNGTISVASASSVTIPGNYMVITGYDPFWNMSTCNDTVFFTVTQGVTLGADQAVSSCASNYDLTTIYNTTGLTTNWYLGAAPVSNPASVSASGNYMIVADDGNGCIDTAYVNLSFGSPTLGADQISSICSNTTLDLTSLYNTTGYNTSWTLNGSPVANPSSVNASGNYILIADASGCSDTAVVTVSTISTPSLGADLTASICTGSIFDLTTMYNTTGFSITWTTGSIPVANPASVSAAGSYVLIAGTSGCTDTAVVYISVTPSPALGANTSYGICAYDSADLGTFFNTTGLTTAWTLGGNPVANPSSVNQPGTYQLIASSSGCSDTALMHLTILPTPGLGADQNVTLCSGDTINLNILYVNTYPAVWYSGGSANFDASAVQQAGTYQIIETSGANCSDTADVIVTVNNLPPIGPDQQVTACDGIAIDLTTLYNTSGNTATWTLSGNAVPLPSAITDPGIYIITVTDPAGCSTEANATVSFNGSPVLGSDQTVSICDGGTTDITSYYSITSLQSTWTLNGNPVIDTTNVDDDGIYMLVATNTDGCSDTANVLVNVNANPDPGPAQVFDLCPWETIDLSSLFNTSGFTTSYFYFGSPITVNVVSDSGIYTVVISDANGCTGQSTATINTLQCLCVADFNYEAHCLQDPVKFEVIADSAVLSVHWVFADALPDQYDIDPTVKFKSAGNLMVTLIADLSCGTVTVQKYVKVEDCSDSCRLYIPTAFTPNDDGKNDKFESFSECTPEEFSFEVRNRFGQVIFSTTNPELSWDGRFQNKEAPSDLYVFHVEYKLPYQDKQVSSGLIRLLR